MRETCRLLRCDLPAVDYLVFAAYPDEKIWLCAEHFDNWGALLGEKLKNEDGRLIKK